MKHQIIEKLNKHLDNQEFSSEFWSESLLAEVWILYLLAQIRKVLDWNRQDKYPTLRLYCNWVLHISLDNRIAQGKVAMLSERPGSEEVTKFLNFITLHEELDDFFTEQNLPNAITVGKKGEWFEFRNALMRILKDQPLKNTVGLDITTLTLIDNPLSKNTDSYFINFEAQTVSGESIPFVTLLGDYGGERRERIEKKQVEFWRNFFLKKLGYHKAQVKK